MLVEGGPDSDEYVARIWQDCITITNDTKLGEPAANYAPLQDSKEDCHAMAYTQHGTMCGGITYPFQTRWSLGLDK